MNNISRKLKTLSITTLLICFTGVSQTASADIGLPDSPLFLGTSVPPNIFFSVDDSGSMNWDEILNAGTWAPGAAITGQFVNFLPIINNFSTGDRREIRRLTCRGYNVMAYDPAITYDPWRGEDSAGNAYTDATYPNARVDPYNPGTTFDLSTQFYFPWTDGLVGGVADGEYDGPADGSPEGFAASANAATDECADVSDQTDAVLISALTAIQQTNYANWYSYFRKREYVMKRSLSELITNSVSNMGLATLHNNSAVGTPITDMTAQTNKDALLSELFQINSSGGTPLRLLLENTGEYYDQAGNNSDHSPLGFSDASPIQNAAGGGECQQNFSILFTDGEWNGSNPSVGNTDQDGTGTFDGGPHADANSNTLADVAMAFYEKDLSTTLANNIPENDYTDPNTNIIYTDDNPQQHMVTYGVAFGLTGNGLTTPIDHDSATATPPWTTPTDSATKLDDMQHAAFNGRGLFLNASNPQELITALNDSLSDIDQRTSVSGSAIAINSTVLKTTSRIFQASFNSVDWTGELSAFSLNADGTVDQEEWTATANFPTTITDPDDRNIFTSVSTGGIAFDDAPANAELNTAIGTLLVGSTTYTAADLIHYISGDQSNEGSATDDLRVRSEILGDIVSSSPISIGDQDLGYDSLSGFSGVEGTSYTTFLGIKTATFTDGSGDPQTAVYVGSNDGMFHAFHDSQSTSTDGDELFAYIPSALHGDLSELAEPGYGHLFYINGSHSVGDACIANGSTCTWKSILIGSLGEGGRTIFALDVTDPFNFDATDVLWEYNFDDTRTGTTNSGEMGFIKGAPQVVRLNNGKWGIIFGNGYNSDSDTAKIFILDAEDGTEIVVMDTKIGDSSNENGMAAPLIVDEDGDRIADTIYSGDLFGNLFKFDISDSNDGNWETVFEESGGAPATRKAEPLFQAVDAGGNTQQISTRPTIVVNDESGDGGFNIIFGTGKYLETSDTTVLSPYQVETMYSIWDDDQDDNGSQVSGLSKLVQQFITEEVDVTVGTTTTTTRIVSTTTIDYTGVNPDRGWYMEALKPTLDSSTANGERIISDPLTRFGRAIFTTFIPPSSPCDTGGTSVLMEIDALSGARLEDSVFDINGDGIIDDDDFVTDQYGNKVPVSGIYIPGTLTSPAVISLSDPDQEAKQLSGIDSQTTTVLESTGGITVGRQSWRQLK